jgi:hypothetical protein
MIPITAFAKTRERRKAIDGPARGNVAAKSVEIESPRKPISPPSLQREVSIHTAAETDDVLSLKILWMITLGILTVGVLAAITTIIISN